jgi:uncharacterized damage-inducible protein DinB
MLTMLRDLVQHKWWANAAALKAIGEHDQASQDPELRKLLHHVILSNRFWFSLSLGRPFTLEEESKVPESLGGVAALYRDTQVEEHEWIFRLQESDLSRTLETPFLPGRSFSVAEAQMQVCLHSQGHRAQCAVRLRLLGGVPRGTDYIFWLKDRPVPDWL